MSQDPYDSQYWKDYTHSAITKLLPKMKASDVVVSIASDSPDVKQATEIGFALLLGKPVVILKNTVEELPPGLVRAADKIIEGSVTDQDVKLRLRQALLEIHPDFFEEDKK